MIIWRGWGVMAFVYFLATGIFGIGIPYSIGGVGARWAMIPVGLLCGAACWFHGRYLNVIKPTRAIEVEFPALREQLFESVGNGSFRLPNQPPPTSLDQARGQAEAYLQMVESALANGTNRHTLFFVPFQYWGILIALWAVVMPFLVT